MFLFICLAHVILLRFEQILDCILMYHSISIYSIEITKQRITTLYIRQHFGNFNAGKWPFLIQKAIRSAICNFSINLVRAYRRVNHQLINITNFDQLHTGCLGRHVKNEHIYLSSKTQHLITTSKQTLQTIRTLIIRWSLLIITDLQKD